MKNQRLTPDFGHSVRSLDEDQMFILRFLKNDRHHSLPVDLCKVALMSFISTGSQIHDFLDLVAVDWALIRFRRIEAFLS